MEDPEYLFWSYVVRRSGLVIMRSRGTLTDWMIVDPEWRDS
jgi:hypothetical protein